MSRKYTELKALSRAELTPEDVTPTHRRAVPMLLAGALVVTFLLLQIFPLIQDFSNPPVLAEPQWDSQETYMLAQRACWDCHSNQTHWPWYAKLAPISMTLARDVERGRGVLNFSEWEPDKYDVEELVETISKNQMPPPFYLVLHPEADISNDERGRLINGLIATMQGRFLDAENMDASDEEETGGKPGER